MPTLQINPFPVAPASPISMIFYTNALKYGEAVNFLFSPKWIDLQA